MKLPLLITLFGIATPMMVQNDGAGVLERDPDSLRATLKQYMEAIQSQHQPLHGHTFDYRLSRVSDLESRDTISLESVLHNIRSETQEAIGFSDLSLILSENYIKDAGFKILVDFLLAESNKDLLRAISSIDLSNNRITDASAQDVKRLLDQAHQLQLDLSINYIMPKALSAEISARVKCRAF
jgi:hypothetical protein